MIQGIFLNEGILESLGTQLPMIRLACAAGMALQDPPGLVSKWERSR